VKTRREFLRIAGFGGAALAQAAAQQIGAPAPNSTRKIRLAVVGGGFGSTFHWHEHPNCVVSAVTDLYALRRQKLRDAYRCDSVYESLEDMLDKRSDLDAVAVFSGAVDHVRHVTMCMERGFHVISAVPACQSLEEAQRLKEVKEKTGRTYMMAESNYYRAGCIYARSLFQQGGFGDLFYSEVEYYHDFPPDQLLANKQSLWYHPDGATSWRQGLPPMQYPTHSLGYVMGVTSERIVSVSCLGWGANHPFYRERKNQYGNPLSNEFALMQTHRGHMVRCNVFWNVVASGEQARWFGDKGSLYMALEGLNPDTWHARKGKAKPLRTPNYLDSPMLPVSMRHASGHGGSAAFLTAEFINALIDNRQPACDLYDSLAMTVPGIVAHQSALKGGEQMKVPQFRPDG
jgi:predicted dehydrogenase